ncbi:hypothetical protein [Baekduia sp. Peel2402]|uniref:hypothetical protein n=1 Tax=Baekduia sp. Peel2402 TaxID=3458296 RepID=UPI00403E6A43
MELVAALRLLWRHRLLVALMAVIGVLVALSLAYRIGFPPKLESRHYNVGVGSITALVDTPNSQVVDLGGDTGSDIATLSARAGLLASLIASSPIKDQIAAQVGIDNDKLITASADPTTGASGAVAVKDDQHAYILKSAIANVDSGQIPIISVRTQAPSAEDAEKLANASIDQLKAHIQQLAGSDNVPERRRVVVRELGPARAATVSRGSSPIIGLIFGVLVFLLGCGAIVGSSALVRGWRRAEELESRGATALPDEGALEEPPGPVARLAAVDITRRS